jgi:hypothetical protein
VNGRTKFKKETDMFLINEGNLFHTSLYIFVPWEVYIYYYKFPKD